MNKLENPYDPGQKSSRLEDVIYLAWNKQVPHILASSSTNGSVVIWDLRSRREIIDLQNPNGKKNITSIAWNPDVVCFSLRLL